MLSVMPRNERDDGHALVVRNGASSSPQGNDGQRNRGSGRAASE